MDLKTDVHTGKTILMAILNGGSVPPNFVDNPHLISLQRDARFIRWLACSQLPEFYSQVRDDRRRGSRS